MASLRAALAKQGLNGCPNGLRGIVPFYKASKEGRRAFGFNRLSDILRALRWPTGFISHGDYPANDSKEWQDNLQGLTHDDESWFLTRREYLQTMPLGTGMDDLGDYHFDDATRSPGLGNKRQYPFRGNGVEFCRVAVPDGYNHLGALTIQRLGAESVLYMPVQGDGQPPILYAVLIKNNLIQDYNWRSPLSESGDQAAWCAYDPIGRCLYTSLFYDNPGSSIDVYDVGTPAAPHAGRPLPGEALQLTLLGHITLRDSDQPASLHRIQGGVITANRHLYLVKDDGFGIVGYDLITGQRMAQIPVNYDKQNGITGWFGQELEGICALPDGAALHFMGQLHVILWENGSGPFGKDFWIKHYGVANSSEAGFL